MNLVQKSPAKLKQSKFNNTLNGSYTMAKWDLSLGYKDDLAYKNQSNVIYNINRMKDKINLEICVIKMCILTKCTVHLKIC